MGRRLLLPQRRCFVAFTWGSVSPFLHAECSPLPPNRKAFVDPETGRNCTGLAWQGDRLSSWLPVGHCVPAACRHGHSRDHLSQRSSLDPIQNGMPRTALKAPAISCLRTSVTGHHSTEKKGTEVPLDPPLALTPSSSLSGVLLRPPQTHSVIQTLPQCEDLCGGSCRLPLFPLGPQAPLSFLAWPACLGFSVPASAISLLGLWTRGSFFSGSLIQLSSLVIHMFVAPGITPPWTHPTPRIPPEPLLLPWPLGQGSSAASPSAPELQMLEDFFF